VEAKPVAPSFLQAVEERSAVWVTLMVLALVVAIGWADHITGWELSFSIFYMVPVALGSWRGGTRAALALSALCGVAWFTADVTSGHAYSLAWIPYWNALVRFGMFVALGLTLATLRGTLGRAHQLARVDVLTGLANLRSFHEQLAYHLDAATRHHDAISLASIDLDRFKYVNDQLGHHEGDRALVAVAETIAGTVRRLDVCARVGGDEFAVLLPRTDEHGASEALEKLRLAIEQTMRENGWPITASIGVATCQGRIQAGEFLRAGDRLLYRAKGEGGNRVLGERLGLSQPAEAQRVV
jgi:diguanylate cyclase (GGDEF)-like protein